MERSVQIDRLHSLNGNETSGCGHADFAKPTLVLSAEHRVIERALDILERLARSPADNSVASWQKILDFFSHFADQCHHLKEEQVLFPAMEEHGIPRDGGPIGVMLMEHEEGRSYVRSIKAALSLVETKTAGAAESLVSSAQAYLRLLREHIQKEDEILFRIADDVIPPEEQNDLLEAFNEHEAREIGPGVHEKYLRVVEELERNNEGAARRTAPS